MKRPVCSRNPAHHLTNKLLPLLLLLLLNSNVRLSGQLTICICIGGQSAGGFISVLPTH